jgi:hypothetical protein
MLRELRPDSRAACRFCIEPVVYRVLELALHRSLGKLPEPESTHEFF